MDIKQLAEKYKLDPKNDFWKHMQSGKWIITHDACEKIAHIEGINFAWNKVTGEPLFKVIYNEPDLVRISATMTNGNAFVTTTGEAGKLNCQSKYYLNMAEKRCVDRCILKLINAYEYGVYSDSEADNFKKPKDDIGEIKTAPIPATQKQKNLIMSLEQQANVKRHIEFSGLTTKQASEYIDKLNNKIKGDQDGQNNQC